MENSKHLQVNVPCYFLQQANTLVILFSSGFSSGLGWQCWF